MSPPRWLHWPAASAGADWDTFDNGISNTVLSTTGWTSFTWDLTPTDAEAANLSVINRFVADDNTNYIVLSSILNTSAQPTEITHLAIWNITDNDWYVLDYLGLESEIKTGGNAKRWAFDIDTMESRSGTADNTSFQTNDDVRLVFLSQYTSGSISNWSDFV